MLTTSGQHQPGISTIAGEMRATNTPSTATNVDGVLVVALVVVDARHY